MPQVKFPFLSGNPRPAPGPGARHLPLVLLRGDLLRGVQVRVHAVQRATAQRPPGDGRGAPQHVEGRAHGNGRSHFSFHFQTLEYIRVMFFFLSQSLDDNKEFLSLKEDLTAAAKYSTTNFVGSPSKIQCFTALWDPALFEQFFWVLSRTMTRSLFIMLGAAEPCAWSFLSRLDSSGWPRAFSSKQHRKKVSGLLKPSSKQGMSWQILPTASWLMSSAWSRSMS